MYTYRAVMDAPGKRLRALGSGATEFHSRHAQTLLSGPILPPAGCQEQGLCIRLRLSIDAHHRPSPIAFAFALLVCL